MTRPTRRAVLAVALAAMLVLAGCSGGGDSERADGGADVTTVQETVTEEGTGDGGSGDYRAGSADGAADRQADAQQRHRVRTGEATVRVEAFEPAAGNLTATTRRLGGFVADTERRRHRDDNETWLTGRLVLRVPAGNFSALQDAVAAEGTVEHSASSVDDVTGRVVDLRARLENLRAQRDRLRGLYEAANETEDVLAVGRRLSDTQSEIERLEGELAALQNRVAYSTLTVELREPEPETDDEVTTADAWYETGVLAALLESVGGVATTLRMLVVGAAYLLPYLAVFGTPVVAVVAWRRRRRGRSAGLDGRGPDARGPDGKGPDDDGPDGSDPAAGSPDDDGGDE